MTYFPVPTSAPQALWTTKPPPEVPNCVPGSLAYPLDAVVTAHGRLGGLGPQAAQMQISRLPSQAGLPKSRRGGCSGGTKSP